MPWLVFLVSVPVFSFAEIVVFDSGIVIFDRQDVAKIMEEEASTPVRISGSGIEIVPWEGDLFEIRYEGTGTGGGMFRGSCFGQMFVPLDDGTPGVDIFYCTQPPRRRKNGFNPAIRRMERILDGGITEEPSASTTWGGGWK